MISYEELVAALDRYVARHGGTPESVHAPSPSSFPPPPRAPSPDEPATRQTSMPSIGYDEHHDPDLGGHGDHGDATHVGASPMPPPLAPAGDEEHHAEIDLGDVLTDDEV